MNKDVTRVKVIAELDLVVREYRDLLAVLGSLYCGVRLFPLSEERKCAVELRDALIRRRRLVLGK